MANSPLSRRFDVPDHDITNLTPRGIAAVLQRTTPNQNVGGYPMAAIRKKGLKEHPARASNICKKIAMCDFIDNIKDDALAKVPTTMPASLGSLGFDSPLWVGLGTVGLWAALDAFADRAKINNNPCDICRIRCIPSKFASYTKATKRRSFKNWKTCVISAPTIMLVTPMKNILITERGMCLRKTSILN
jgi:hypothetical protein